MPHPHPRVFREALLSLQQPIAGFVACQLIPGLAPEAAFLEAALLCLMREYQSLHSPSRLQGVGQRTNRSAGQGVCFRVNPKIQIPFQGEKFTCQGERRSREWRRGCCCCRGGRNPAGRRKRGRTGRRRRGSGRNPRSHHPWALSLPKRPRPPPSPSHAQTAYPWREGALSLAWELPHPEGRGMARALATASVGSLRWRRGCQRPCPPAAPHPP